MQLVRFILLFVSIIFLSKLGFSQTCTPTPLGNIDAISGLVFCVNEANNGSFDVINLGGSVYTFTTSNDNNDGNSALPSITGTFSIVNGTIERAISSPNDFRLIHISASGVLTLDHIILQNGVASAGVMNGSNGGAIFNRGNLTVKNSTISDNIATGINIPTSGGGIYNFQGTINSITSSTISENTATVSAAADLSIFASGGGIYNFQGTINSIISSTIAGNTVTANNITPAGGGIYNFQGTINSITSSIISDNEANEGGGISNGGEITNIINSTISDNNAGDNAGGIINGGEITNITNSTLSGNTATRTGGGILNNFNAMITNITNSTIFDNTANLDEGGGIFNNIGAVIANITNSTISGNKVIDASGDGGGGISNKGAITNMISNIVAENTAPAGKGPDIFNQEGGTIASTNHNLIGNNQGVEGIFFMPNINNNLVGTDGDPLDPLLGPLKFNGGPTKTMALILGSPAINTGINPDPANIKFDQRGPGFPRTSGLDTDIGAYELRTCF